MFKKGIDSRHTIKTIKLDISFSLTSGIMQTVDMQIVTPEDKTLTTLTKSDVGNMILILQSCEAELKDGPL